MAIKDYIITQTTDWNGGGEKSGTHRVTMDSAEISNYVGMLEGRIKVFEENLALSINNATATTSDSLVDSIRISHSVLKTQYIQNSNKRPIVLNSRIESLVDTLKRTKPFPAPYTADNPKDVSVDSGKTYLM